YQRRPDDGGGGTRNRKREVPGAGRRRKKGLPRFESSCRHTDQPAGPPGCGEWRVTLKIHILLFDGFDELDAIGPFEVLRNAAARAGNAGGQELQVELVRLHDTEQVTGAHGLRVQPHACLDAEQGQRPDLLIVPGGGWNNRAPQGAWTEAERGDIPRAIASLHAAGTAIASVCTGAMLLAAAGPVKGRRAATHSRAVE